MKHRRMRHCCRRCYLIGGLFLMLTIFVGCGSSQQNISLNETGISVNNPTATREITIAPSATMLLPTLTKTPITVTPTSSPSATSTSTATTTPIPINTPTVTATLASILTPLPTILPSERGQTYDTLMDNNGNCSLPCWWGFEPGKTLVQYIEQFYISLGPAFVITEDFGNGRSQLTIIFEEAQIEDGIQVAHMFRAQDGIFVEAEVEVVYDPNYQITPLLQRLGPPEEVWFWTIPDSYEGVLPVSLYLFFPNGVLVSYAVFGERIGNMVQACFNDEGGTKLLLWKPNIWDADSNKGFVERANDSGGFTLNGRRPLDEVSNWDEAALYANLLNPNSTECLQTPSNLWSPP